MKEESNQTCLHDCVHLQEKLQGVPPTHSHFLILLPCAPLTTSHHLHIIPQHPHTSPSCTPQHLTHHPHISLTHHPHTIPQHPHNGLTHRAHNTITHHPHNFMSPSHIFMNVPSIFETVSPAFCKREGSRERRV